MSAKTKIVVLRMKEIIYTAIFAGLALLLIALFLIMFGRDKASSPSETPSQEASYIPGAVSYTHLDVYKRQAVSILFIKALSQTGKNDNGKFQSFAFVNAHNLNRLLFSFCRHRFSKISVHLFQPLNIPVSDTHLNQRYRKCFVFRGRTKDGGKI